MDTVTCGICLGDVVAITGIVPIVDNVYSLLDQTGPCAAGCTAKHVFHADCLVKTALYQAANCGAEHYDHNHRSYTCPFCRGEYSIVYFNSSVPLALPSLAIQKQDLVHVDMDNSNDSEDDVMSLSLEDSNNDDDNNIDDVDPENDPHAQGYTYEDYYGDRSSDDDNNDDGDDDENYDDDDADYNGDNGHIRIPRYRADPRPAITDVLNIDMQSITHFSIARPVATTFI